jgi:hypothetical protein
MKTAKKKTRKKITFDVNASYDAQYYPEKDGQLEKIVGRSSNGSGMGMGERDLSWYCGNLNAAMVIFRKLLRVKKLTSLSLMVIRD